MNVSMDGLRKSLIANYNSLTKKLNSAIRDEHILINPHEIQREMEALRNGLVTIAFIYIEGEFDSMSEQTHFEEFNNIENE